MIAYRRILVLKLEVKRPVGGPRSRWVGNFKWILERESGVLWTGLIWLTLGTGRELL
jgi:hypothetical protein